MKHFIKSLALGLALLVPASAFAENAFLQSTIVYDVNERKLVKFAFANIAAATTDGVIVAAVTGKRIRVLAYSCSPAGTATSTTFNSKGAGAGTAITAANQCPASNIQPGGFSPVGYFQTNAGEGLTATTGTGATVGINITYIEAEP